MSCDQGLVVPYFLPFVRHVINSFDHLLLARQAHTIVQHLKDMSAHLKFLLVCPLKGINLRVQLTEFLLFLISRFLCRNPVPENLLLFLWKILRIRQHVFPLLDFLICLRIVLLIFDLSSTSSLFLIDHKWLLIGSLFIILFGWETILCLVFG